MKELLEFYISLALLVLIGYAGVNSFLYLLLSYIEKRNKK